MSGPSKPGWRQALGPQQGTLKSQNLYISEPTFYGSVFFSGHRQSMKKYVQHTYIHCGYDGKREDGERHREERETMYVHVCGNKHGARNTRDM